MDLCASSTFYWCNIKISATENKPNVYVPVNSGKIVCPLISNSERLHRFHKTIMFQQFSMKKSSFWTLLYNYEIGDKLRTTGLKNILKIKWINKQSPDPIAGLIGSFRDGYCCWPCWWACETVSSGWRWQGCYW